MIGRDGAHDVGTNPYNGGGAGEAPTENAAGSPTGGAVDPGAWQQSQQALIDASVAQQNNGVTKRQAATGGTVLPEASQMKGVTHLILGQSPTGPTV